MDVFFQAGEDVPELALGAVPGLTLGVVSELVLCTALAMDHADDIFDVIPEIGVV